jgi:hypothetical protein
VETNSECNQSNGCEYFFYNDVNNNILIENLHFTQLTHMNGSCLTKDNHLQTNKAEMIKDFRLIGNELVLDVVVINQ